MRHALVKPRVETRIGAITAPGRKFIPTVEALMRASRMFNGPG